MSDIRAQKSDYFTLFNLPPKYDLNLKDLDQAYLKMQSQYHPDRQKHQKANTKTALQAAFINDAYETLKSPTKRAFYLLSLHGVVTPLKEEFTLHDPELLQEIFAWREVMMEAPSPTQVQNLYRELKAKMNACTQDLQQALDQKDWIIGQKLALKLHYYTKLYNDIKQWQRKHKT